MRFDNPSALFKYQAFGLVMASEMAFPELFLWEGDPVRPPDVMIRIGPTPDKAEVVGTQKPFSAFNATEFWFGKSEIARYFVAHGREITVEPLGGSEAEVRLFFLSNVLGALLYQRGLIPFHASGVIAPSGDAYLFTAPSRTGKSTLMYMLMQMGCRPFTDDVCVLQQQEDDPAVFSALASYPVIKLWGETIERFESDAPQAQRRLRTDIDKYGVDFHHAFVTQPVRIKGVVALNTDKQGGDIHIDRLSPIEAFQVVEGNTYRRHWVTGMGREVEHFKHISAVVNHVPVYVATRPVGKDTIRRFAEAIYEAIISTPAADKQA